ncbi:MAG TPA: hypothetical protein DCZ94_07925 [Lentisphaeria bacterium]|nr:MAG: hypothetical protein A2X48_24325 [Lentisphaerae bacterium GWF2_49_21]HBC86865.1 hypothetical protein [Lentisphaeria bacterium]
MDCWLIDFMIRLVESLGVRVAKCNGMSAVGFAKEEDTAFLQRSNASLDARLNLREAFASALQV